MLSRPKRVEEIDAVRVGLCLHPFVSGSPQPPAANDGNQAEALARQGLLS
jgi:hypothetical protein